jgi:epoxyqueuosine reductase QueG
MSSDSHELTATIIDYVTTGSSWINAGADLVGIVPVESINEIDSYWVDYHEENTRTPSDYMEDPVSVIVLGYHAWDDMCEALTLKGDQLEAFGYARMRFSSEKLEKYLTQKGYNAKIANGLPQKQLARLAGFGNYGKNSLIISPRYGPWMRLNTVLTDAVLEYDEPFTEDLCKDCELCVSACPTGALSPYKIDHSRCMAGLHDGEWLELFSGESSFEDFRSVENGDSLFSGHSPRLTRNTFLMCMTCQKACPYGKQERGLKEQS